MLYFFQDGLHVQAIFILELFSGGGMFHEFIGPADSNYRDLNRVVAEEFKDCTAVAAMEHVVFNGDYQVCILCVEKGELFIQGLNKARVDDGSFVTFQRKRLSCFKSHGVHVAQGKDMILLPSLLLLTTSPLPIPGQKAFHWGRLGRPQDK